MVARCLNDHVTYIQEYQTKLPAIFLCVCFEFLSVICVCLCTAYFINPYSFLVYM